MREMTAPATADSISPITDFVNEVLALCGCTEKAQIQIDVAIDELFGNIARYAYRPDSGPATVRVETDREENTVTLTFIDRGIPYNPLTQPDPDVTLGAEDRPEGGLGIFIVKKSMDALHYEYRNGENILTVQKKIR